MATFTVTFNAPQPGTYTCGWRVQGTLVAHTIVNQVVTIPGTNAFIITIPVADNVYCDRYDYEGYIIADCQDQTLDPVTGVPLSAITFTASFNQQADPCPLYTITLNQVPINNLIITNPGIDYAIGDVVVFSGSIVSSPIATVDGIGGVGTGPITSFSVTDPGSVSAIPTISVTSGAGSGAIITANLDISPINLITSSFVCGGLGPIPPIPTWVTPSLGDSIELCSDPAKFSTLPASFTAVDISAANGSCNCITCEEATVLNNSGKGLIVQWQTCHDNSDPAGSITLLQQTIPDAATVVLGCVIPGTVVNLTPASGALTSITYGPC
tara:strand:- start:329 stop:1306 length:978 start_codon:yes stop_codon:yes gene_type:complete